MDGLDWDPEAPVVPLRDVSPLLDVPRAIDDIFAIAEHPNRKLGVLCRLHHFKQSPELCPGHHLVHAEEPT